MSMSPVARQNVILFLTTLVLHTLFLEISDKTLISHVCRKLEKRLNVGIACWT
jgi:hypothetical protein